MEVSDRTLVSRYQKGNQEAFKILVERYQKKVYSIAYGMVHNMEDAMDISQEAFIKVHKYLDNFKGTSSFYTWLYRIVVNLSIDYLRKTGRFSDVDYDDSLDHATDSGKTGVLGMVDGNPAKKLAAKEMGEKIGRAISTLSPNHRAVIVMREIEGLSYGEMAKVLKCSQGTVMSRLHHARLKLQKALGDYLQGDLTIR